MKIFNNSVMCHAHVETARKRVVNGIMDGILCSFVNQLVASDALMSRNLLKPYLNEAVDGRD